uniref:Uncharacterized protein n=1 Tax=Vespula pensylvanica TaxID=30213 RepID=A0A834NSG8_VESPE|nr:hypothetical protein H0235_011751 [Vespula pensylvanica]
MSQLKYKTLEREGISNQASERRFERPIAIYSNSSRSTPVFDNPGLSPLGLSKVKIVYQRDNKSSHDLRQNISDEIVVLSQHNI